MSNIKKRNTLIIVSAAFPYGSGETFLETEFKYHKSNFDKIVIFCGRKNHGSKININNDINVNIFDEYKPFFKISLLFNFPLIKEILKYFFYYKSNFSVIGVKEIISFYLNAQHKANQIELYINNKNIKNDNLVIYSTWMSDSSFALTFLKEKFPLKAVTRTHRFDLYEEENKFNYLPFRKRLVEKLDKIYFISNHGLDYFQNKYSNSIKLELSRLGVKYQTENELNQNNCFTLLSCAFVLKQKRLELIIDSVSKIEKLELKWIHIGDTRDNKYWNYLNDLALNKFANKPNLSFSFLGYKSNQDIIKFYRNNYIDVFINLSTSEGIPIAMMEAISFGVPIIATNVGGVSELVIDKVNGFLLDSNPSPIQVKNAILEYAYKSYSEKSNFKNNAKLTLENLYHSKKNYSIFSKNLKDLIQ